MTSLDHGTSQLTSRDRLCLRWIALQRAIRLDQHFSERSHVLRFLDTLMRFYLDREHQHRYTYPEAAPMSIPEEENALQAQSRKGEPRDERRREHLYF